MKVGKSSWEFQVPRYTIRYHVELGLLVPEVKNHQYSFNEDCRADMKLIKKSKAVGFPLKDIYKILSLRRPSNFASLEDSGKLAPYMEERLREPEQKGEQWEQRKRHLEKRTADLELQITGGRG